MLSDKLRRFPESDPAPRNYSNDELREQIARETAEFLARGGVIQRVGSEANRNPDFAYGGRMIHRSGTDAQ